MRPVDSAKIKKIAKVEKDTDKQTGAKIKGVKEVYVFREKPDSQTAIEIAPENNLLFPIWII